MRALVLRLLVGLLMRTLRIEVRGTPAVDALLARRAPFVFAFWHGSMLVPWWFMRRYNAAALVSMSGDGSLLAALLEGWGYTVVRGSSSRGSKEAMSAMRDLVGEGRVLCITPDGPRGPLHELKMGAVRVAQTTGVPLVYATVAHARATSLGSWDHFEIPWFFTRVTLSFGDPLVIDPAREGEALEDVRLTIEKSMRAQHRAHTAG